MNRKPRKVEEPAAPYTAKPLSARPASSQSSQASLNPASPEARTLDNATFRKAMDRVFTERKELLRKLAQ